MFFSEMDFDEYLTPEEGSLIAKLCNAKLDRLGMVVWGNVFENGEHKGFESAKGEHSTHVALLVGVKMMGTSVPTGSAIRLDKITANEELEFKKANIRRIEQRHKELLERGEQIAKRRG